MLAASDLLKQASAFSQTFSQRVDVWSKGQLILENAPVVSGSISANRASSPRLNCKLVLATEPWKPLPLNNRTCTVRVYRGVESLGRREVLQQGVFRIDDIERGSDGTISLDCSGLEQYIIDARLTMPRTPPYLASTVHTIRDLITEIRPFTVRLESTMNRGITATTPWDKDRWDAVDDLAASIEAEVFADARGEFAIRDIPHTDGQPVLWVTQGVGGVLVDETVKETREQVYNAAVVYNQNTVPGDHPLWAMSYVSDPNDDLYFYGDFGQVPRFAESQYFTASWQCDRYARRLIIDAVARNTSITFTTAPTVWWLEVGDLVGVDMLDGTQEVHLLQTMDADLGPGGIIKFDTLSTKRAARMEDDVPDVSVS